MTSIAAILVSGGVLATSFDVCVVGGGPGVAPLDLPMPLVREALVRLGAIVPK